MTCVALGVSMASSLAWAEDEKAENKTAQSAVIHFADLGGIEDWKVSEDGSLIIEGRNGSLYRATFFGSCPGIRFASSIGFVTDSTGDLDRFSSILVDGERCHFRTLEKLDPAKAGVPKDGDESKE